MKEFRKEFKEDKILNQNNNKNNNIQQLKSNKIINSFEKADTKQKIKEHSAAILENDNNIVAKTQISSEKPKDQISEKNKKKVNLDNSLTHYSIGDNDEFDNLFNDDDNNNNSNNISNFEYNATNASINKNNLHNENHSVSNINKPLSNNEFLESKPKNSMKIKLNFDFNTVELNSKFVEINPDTNMNDSAEAEEEDIDEYEEEKNEENYENDQDNQGENMEIDYNYYEGYDEENDKNSNCILREKSTIITIPNLNFLSEQNFDDAEKPIIEHDFITDKIKSENSKNEGRVINKISNSNENKLDPNSNCKFIYLYQSFYVFFK